MAIETKITKLISAIESGEYLMPEFQRGYVWNASQVKAFVRSLYLGYPTGSFLIWKTAKPTEIRNNVVNQNLVQKKLILDGQQRLTTIYTLFKGETPEWYEGKSLRTDLYFNLNTEEFQYFMPRSMSGKIEWLNVSDYLVRGGFTAFMAETQNMSEEDRAYYLGPAMSKLIQLGNMLEYGYYIKEIEHESPEAVVEIFNLVNKSGTTLSESDLALALISSTWSGTKERLREKVEQYEKIFYKLDFNFFTRLLNILTTKQAKYGQIGKVTSDQFDKAWNKLNRSLDYLINILREDAYISSNEDLSSSYPFYTLVYYLVENGNRFPDEETKNRAIYWMFMSQLWGRYSGSSESFLDKDLNTLQATNSIDGLIDNISLSRGNQLYISPEELAYQGVRSRLYPLFYATIRSKQSKDWTDLSIPLYSRNIGFNNFLQKHHIFPKSFLYKKYNSSNSLDKSLVNEIANMSLITQKSNMEILDGDPADYLPKIEDNQLRKQFVPIDAELYALENYESFLATRRRLIAEGINTFLKSYYNFTSKEQVASDLKIHDESIERIEISLRDKINSILMNSAEENPYLEFIPQHIQGRVSEKILKFLANNPGERSEDYLDLRIRLNFFEMNQYRETIAFKNNWPLFESTFSKKGVFEQKFLQLSELRNCIRHSRSPTEVVQKEGEAAIAWFESILMKA